ncbi:MAG: hypothetical protein K0Q60_4146 [Microvirga sp.]|nr:hypothetical protein [Microvirga sp.]
MARPTQEQVEAEIALLGGLSLEALRERWHALYGNPAPRSLRRDFLIRAVAYQLQVKAFGRLSTATKRKLREIAIAAREGRFDAGLIAPRVKPGTRLIRVWKGETHHVHVLEDGFEWNGSRYGSLSVIAKAITGTNWNGWVFFGVKRRPSRNKNASLEMRQAKAQRRASAALGGQEFAIA